jgi:hypothetical protein
MSEFGTNDASHELIPLYMYALTLPTKQTIKNALPGFAGLRRASPGFAGLRRARPGFAGLRRARPGFARFYHTPIFLDISKTPE